MSLSRGAATLRRPCDDPVPSHGFRASALLDVRGLRLSLTGGADPWPDEGFSLSVGHGETLGLVGDTESGRSELTLVIAGMLAPPAVIHSGSILFNGRELVGRRRRWFGRTHWPRLGSLLAAATPGVAVGRRAERRAERRAGGLLASVRASSHAPADDPELLGFDDQLSEREPADQTAVLAFLAARRAGRTVIIGSADFSVVASVCDRVAVLDAGRIVEQGSTAEILAAPQHPLTRALLGRT
ncbi:ATP-binding cassette domain-containing protein [Cryobacterium algoritolerans]|uniref:ATP-binding cassette domain-containing protein n=1 Tax=Cryobacterium algoritolerans TaxID=1259184 RepID=A0A4R8WZA7_9MICO|nr:ATP-binding cassette domain-containing protein [Cryobacterium algoritolerans]TFC20106.1 ATP-binding cassette domain-containing protein [Cryobacterium algoritolerans]